MPELRRAQRALLLLADQLVFAHKIARRERIRLRVARVLAARALPERAGAQQLPQLRPARDVGRPRARHDPRAVRRERSHVEQRPDALRFAEADSREEHRHPCADPLAGDVIDQGHGRLALDHRLVFGRERLPEREVRAVPAELGAIMVVHVQRARMEILEVVGVDVVFDDDLPVRLDQLLCAVALQLGQFLYAVRAQVRLDVAEPLGERGRVGIGMHPDQPAPDADRGREEADAGRVEIGEFLRAAGHADELAFEVVGPVVIGAA